MHDWINGFYLLSPVNLCFHHEWNPSNMNLDISISRINLILFWLHKSEVILSNIWKKLDWLQYMVSEGSWETFLCFFHQKQFFLVFSITLCCDVLKNLYFPWSEFRYLNSPSNISFLYTWYRLARLLFVLRG